MTFAANPSGASDTAALFARATATHRAGRLEEAEAAYREILALDPAHAEAHNWLGVVCQQKGDGGEALAHMREAVKLAPTSADFANNLGLTEMKQGDLDGARRSFEKAIALNPRLAQAHYNLGLVHQNLRRPGRAIPCFHQAIALAPNYANAQLSLGNALSDIGDHEAAIDVLHRLAAAAPNVPAVLFNLASALRAAQKYEEAAEVARQILARDPDNAVAHNLIALFLWSAGHQAEAEAVARRTIALDPRSIEAYTTLGRALIALGRFDEAKAALATALRLHPGYADAVYLLTMASKEHSTPAFAADAEAMLHGDLTQEDKATLHFALGKIYDDLRDYARAFENYRAGNESAAGTTAFDPAEWKRRVERTTAEFPAAFFARRSSFGSRSRRPVFIVGMPRSGTTLVEQILASHPEVAAGGEMETMPAIAKTLARRIGSTHPYPDCLAELSEAESRDLAAEYLAALDRVSRTAPRVTDKLPLNFLNLGLIALLFPQATIIHCRRDPLDTCLSCYFARFSGHLGFTFSLEALGAYYRGYRRMMRHWHDALPLPVLDVDYEELIANQEAVSRRIVAHCGLEWDERCLDFHKTERPVTTASLWQVRQPIYKTAVKRWQHYEPFLGPLRAALEDEAAP